MFLQHFKSPLEFQSAGVAALGSEKTLVMFGFKVSQHKDACLYPGDSIRTRFQQFSCSSECNSIAFSSVVEIWSSAIETELLSAQYTFSSN